MVACEDRYSHTSEVNEGNTKTIQYNYNTFCSRCFSRHAIPVLRYKRSDSCEGQRQSIIRPQSSHDKIVTGEGRMGRGHRGTRRHYSQRFI